MAEVFEAELVGERGFVRKVALKRMLPAAASDPRSARRFLDEARIASQLHHANIVAVLDVGLLDGLPFQVLELVDGIDAAELAFRAGGTLPLDVALAIAHDVARALDHAHHARGPDGQLLGIVHRDVKPANVLLSTTGDVKLADFGIALARDREARTETGMIAGTLGFIAPEQRTRGEVDGRSDVFALGLTLHALVTGRSPLHEVTAEMALLGGAPLALDDGLPAPLRALIAHAVMPARLARPTAGELAASLAKLLDRDPRSTVRAFVAAHTARAAAPRGALDDLLGIVVEPEVAEVAEVPRYRTVASPSVPARRWHRIVVPLVALGVLGGGAWFAVQRRSGSTAPLDAPRPDASADAPPDALPDALVDAPPDAPVDAIPRDAARRLQTRADAAATQSLETGWIQVVGGEALVGARVVVDGGKWTFDVPHKHEVRVGVHRIEVIERDGTRHPARSLEVTTFHTVRSPAKLTF